MQPIFDDTLYVHYGYAFLSPADEEDPDLDESRRGQINGLLGAGVRGALSIMTGTHTGGVPIRVDWYESTPTLHDEWQDVVEASLEVLSTEMRLAAFEDARAVRFPATGPHRVRLCATGMDAARSDQADADDRAPDRYVVELWPAPLAPDAILRVGGPTAQYWHDQAQELNTMSEQDWSARRAANAAQRNAPDAYQPWRPAVGQGWTKEQVLAGVPASLRFELRAPLARMACEGAGIADLDPVRGALATLAKYGPLPANIGSVEDVIGTVQMQLAGAESAAGWDEPAPEAAAAAVRAVFAAADPEAGFDLLPLLDLVEAATGVPGEQLIAHACAERGYG